MDIVTSGNFSVSSLFVIVGSDSERAVQTRSRGYGSLSMMPQGWLSEIKTHRQPARTLWKSLSRIAGVKPLSIAHSWRACLKSGSDWNC